MVTVALRLLRVDLVGFFLRTQHLPRSSSGRRPYFMEENHLWIPGRLLSVGSLLSADIQIGETL